MDSRGYLIVILRTLRLGGAPEGSGDKTVTRFFARDGQNSRAQNDG